MTTVSPFFGFVLALVIPGALVILLAALLWTGTCLRHLVHFGARYLPSNFSIEAALASLHQVEDCGCAPIGSSSRSVFGSRLLGRLAEHPCSISDDTIARARRVS